MSANATQFCPSCGAETADGDHFCPSCGTALRKAGAFSQQDELRPVTALFADIVGSTALGERLQPDEVKALVGECVSMMSRAVEEYGGTVQAYMGDGICAYFGVPVAHEDDPERAARTALRILEVVGRYAQDIAEAWGISDFNVRLGINTGQTAVGLVGAADRQAVALGDTTNVAARLQSAAAPGTIAVGEQTARRLVHRFVFEPLGDLSVKGRGEPVPVARLVRPRVPDATAAPAAPLFGRDGELTELRTAVDELTTGRGQIVLVVGEAGLGKTRLLIELRSIAGVDFTWLGGSCHSYGGLASWPFIEILRGWIGVEEGEAEIAIRTKARAKLGAVLGAELFDLLPALGRLLRIRLDPQLEEPRLENLAQEIRRAYIRWIEALAAQRPVVLCIDDLHWADASTRELAEDLLELTDRAPLLVATALAGDAASEGQRFRMRVLADFRHRATELSLAPLSDDAAGQLLTTLLPGALDDAARGVLVSRAEGNPLYLEELLRSLVESGGIERRHRTWTVTVSSSDLIPPALENVLVARIDRLPESARKLVQAAAAIGRTFPTRVLERVAGGDDFGTDLAVLLRAEIVREVRRYPELECTFKHGLLQEAALSTLTAARRRELYGAVAAAFEQLYAGSLDDHLERLAHYHAQAENLPRALEYLERAATGAEALAAGPRAQRLWTRMKEVASRLGDEGAERRAGDRLLL